MKLHTPWRCPERFFGDLPQSGYGRSTVYITVEMVADSFTGQVFNIVERLFKNSGWTAGLCSPCGRTARWFDDITNIGGKLAEAITETPPFMKAK